MKAYAWLLVACLAIAGVGCSEDDDSIADPTDEESIKPVNFVERSAYGEINLTTHDGDTLIMPPMLPDNLAWDGYRMLLSSWLRAADLYVEITPGDTTWGLLDGNEVVYPWETELDWEDWYGIGAFICDDNTYVYTAPNDNSLLASVNLYLDWPLDLPDGSELRGLVTKTDYGLLHLTALDKAGDWIEVESNQYTGHRLWMKDGHGGTYFDWPGYLLQSFSIGWEDDPLVYAEPGTQAEQFELLSNDETAPARIVEVNGDWIRMYRAWGEVSPDTEYGWLPWREGNRLTIRIYWIY
ncbi:hypothetical protein KQI52_06970 [bacterium]|nr:hypothetical protein [bacterium]